MRSEATIGSRLKRAWNAFTNRDPPGKNYYGGGSSYRPDRVRLNRANDRTIMTAIYTRIAMDAAGITINHVRLDENGRYDETVDSGLNCCLNLSGDTYTELFSDMGSIPIASTNSSQKLT